MEDEYTRERPKREESKTPDNKPKKVQRVVTGEAVQRKKPLGKRFLETFLGGDARGVGQYIVADVMIPAAKDMFADAITQGIERTLFGEVRSTSRRGGLRPPSYGHTPYNRYSSSPTSRRELEAQRPSLSRRARTLHDFSEIIVPTRVEADEVMDQLFRLIDKYESATVADLYEMVGISGEHTDLRWGWTDIRGARIDRVRSGYLLNLPRPEPLD